MGCNTSSLNAGVDSGSKKEVKKNMKILLTNFLFLSLLFYFILFFFFL